MNYEPWKRHIPDDPMPCKCGESVVEVMLRGGGCNIEPASYWDWGKSEAYPNYEITSWRFVERKGEDVIAADPYDRIIWDEDDTAIVVLKVPGQPKWVRDDDLVRFGRGQTFTLAANWSGSWDNGVAFQIKRRPVLTPAVPQVLALLSVATDDEADAIRSAARRANIEMPR